MKTLKISSDTLELLNKTAKLLTQGHNTYTYYSKVIELRTELVRNMFGNNSICVNHERDLQIFETFTSVKGFTSEDLYKIQGYGIDGMPYHCLNADGKVCHQAENGGISMSLGAPEFRPGKLVTTLKVPSERYKLVVED